MPHHLYVWNLLQDEDSPILSEYVCGSAERGAPARLTGLSLYSGTLKTRAPAVALAFDNGDVRVHALDRRLYSQTSDEHEMMQAMLGMMR